MEKTPTQQADRERSAARSMLVVGQYEELKRLAGGVCRLVPLKGISLLLSVYDDGMRDAGDIDVLVYPPLQAAAFAERLEKAGYMRQFDYLRDEAAMAGKQKMAFLARTPLETDVDVHTAFVTKKFFRCHCGNFNSDALERCTISDGAEARMDRVDEWIFLAQHACFHRFGQEKWLMDLRRLLDMLTAEERLTLAERCVRYGFRRVALMACDELETYAPDAVSLCLARRDGDDEFLRVGRRMLHGCHGRFMRRIIAWMWELFMIDSRKGRRKAYVRFIFPSTGELKAIYRSSSRWQIPLLRAVHSLPAFLAVATFCLDARVVRWRSGGGRTSGCRRLCRGL